VVGEVNAATHIELLAHQGGWGHYRLSPHTGQTHQLRVHMNALGLPLRGDRIYPSLLPEPTAGEPEDFNAPLQLLARSIAFTDPVTGLAHRFESRRNLEFPVSGSSMSLAL
jgi:tRNA pseudouridine32 synthase/23S rRNA pseudouridine746 synthase